MSSRRSLVLLFASSLLSLSSSAWAIGKFTCQELDKKTLKPNGLSISSRQELIATDSKTALRPTGRLADNLVVTYNGAELAVISKLGVILGYSDTHRPRMTLLANRPDTPEMQLSITGRALRDTTDVYRGEMTLDVSSGPKRVQHVGVPVRCDFTE